MSHSKLDAARHYRIIAGDSELTAGSIKYHAQGLCSCLPREEYVVRSCAAQGHATQLGPWGLHCPSCGTPLPERLRRHGDWVALGEYSRAWVPR